MNRLAALKQASTVVADTADFRELAQFQPRDATTNPSLILKAVQKSAYAPLLKQTVNKFAGKEPGELADRLLVRFGLEILSIVSGRVSTEVDARLSFDMERTYQRAKRIVDLYVAEGVPIERILIKLAATWEGIRAAEELEREGIRTNLTLVFSLFQAVACGHAKVQLVSPFVGRIYDWHRKSAGASWSEAERAGACDPGVQSVHQIYAYFKQFGVATEIMAASFRNIEQILALAGCDLLTISPELLSLLAADEGPVTRVLDPMTSRSCEIAEVSLDESSFRFALNEDAMATEKLAEGIRVFSADSRALDALLAAG